MNRAVAGVVTLGGILLIGAVDFVSGVEIRTFPLYYAPVSLAAWHFGLPGAGAAAALAAGGWFLSNQLAGMEYSHPFIWVANTLMQGASFTIVGLLVARLRNAVQRERALGRTDPLCQLLNRRAFYDEGRRLMRLCRRGRRPVTLAYLDVDDFKDVNDSLGHEGGDEILRRVAGAIRSSVRGSDVAARLGGDEFAILLPELGAAEARQALERLLAAVREAVAGVGPVTLSVGAVTFLEVGDELEDLVHRADSVMYAAKRQGKNQVVFAVDDESPMTPSLARVRGNISG